MRSAWRGLTLRGRALLLCGLLVALAAVALGQDDLVRVAALLVALPLASALLLTRRDDRVSVQRELEPRQVPVGGTAVVRLRLQGAGSRTAGPLLVTDELDPSLGTSPRVLALRLPPGRAVDAAYEVEARSRGRHRIGPMTLGLEDPFGLVQNKRTTESTHTLVVTPAVAPLHRMPDVVTAGGTGDGNARRTAAAGQDDVGTREYRAGDELRRVHWRSTARTGELMVRQEEQPWDAEALVLLDVRRHAHAGTAGSAADPSTSSFEWAVHATASVVSHLADSGRRVRLVAGATDLTVAGGSAAPALDALAVVRPANDGVLVPAGSGRGGAPLVVAVVGTYDALDAEALGALRLGASGGLAMVVDRGSWDRTPLPPAQDHAVTAPLRASGWRAVVARRGDTVPDAWERVLG